MWNRARRLLTLVVSHASSAADLSFAEDESVGFPADGLLCSMAPEDHRSAASEMRRILKPTGKAFLQSAQGSIRQMDKAEWEAILEGFEVERRNVESSLEDYWWSSGSSSIR